MTTPRSAAILAGGLGTRLRSVVADRPKVLAPVGGRPFLTRLLDQLARSAVRKVVLLTGHRAEQVRAAFGEGYGGLELVYSDEPQPLGTGGALRHALAQLDGPTLLLLNGDSYCDIDLDEFQQFHQEQRAGVSLALVRVADASRYGRVECDAEGRVVRFEEKRPGATPGWINAGVYLIERRLLEDVPSGRPLSLERDLLPPWTAQGIVRGFRCPGRFLDIGTPESYAAAEEFFGHGSAQRRSEREPQPVL